MLREIKYSPTMSFHNLEYNVLSDLIELYRNQPCLWDANSADYTCKKKRNMAWELLLEKFKEIDPNAEIKSVRKKIERLKGCYNRELKKVNQSILESQSKEDIHKPTLWYYNLLSFLPNKDHYINRELYQEIRNKRRHYCEEAEHDQDFDEQQNDGVYMLIVNDNFDPTNKIEKTKIESPEKASTNKKFKQEKQEACTSEKKKNDSQYTQEMKYSIQNTPKIDQATTSNSINPFAVYVGKQLEEMSDYQRKVAEKVISEVIFLGKTDSLSFHSRVESAPITPNVPQWTAPCVIRQNPTEPQNKVPVKRKLTLGTKPFQQFIPILPKPIQPVRSNCMTEKKNQFIVVKRPKLPDEKPKDPLTTDCSSDSDAFVPDEPSNCNDSNPSIPEVKFKNEDKTTNKDKTTNQDKTTNEQKTTNKNK